MSTHRFRRLDRHTAEQLLRGEPVLSAEPDALSDLLSAAAAPATEGELAGETAALAAFRGAHPGPVVQPRRRSMIGSLTVKVAAAAVGTVAAGGVALAASTGALPGHSGGGTPPPPPAVSRPAVTTTVPETGDSGAGQDKTPGNAASSPAPSVTGLCQAYGSGQGKENGKALQNPAFGALITAAGGADRVPAYCAGVLAEKHGGESKPAVPSQAQDRGQGPKPAHPTGPPENKSSH